MARHNIFSSDHPLALIGCGNMGQALARGWWSAGLPKDALVILERHPEKRSDFHHEHETRHVPTLELLADMNPQAVFLCVKPHQLEGVLKDVTSAFPEKHPLILSAAAGKTLSFYEARLWDKAPIIRIMPNTPVTHGAGMHGMIGNAHVSPPQREAIDALMQGTGATLWLENEEQMHALTAVSGSGPAYVFYLMECLVDAAMQHGFAEADANLLVRQTFFGASQMAQHETAALSQMREQVTSPNGTTQAGLEALMQSDTAQVLMQTIAAAKTRSEEISST